MPELAQSLNLLVAEAHEARAGLTTTVAATAELPASLDLAPAETHELAAALNGFVGPAVQAPLDLAVAEPVELPVGLDALLGPAGFAYLDVRTGAVGLERAAQLDSAVAQTQTPTASLETLAAIERTFTACLCVPVAGTDERTACLDASIVCPGPSKLLTPSMSVLIGVTRNACVLPMNVLIDPSFGLQALLNMLVVARQKVEVDLDANVKSPDLKIGASVTYNQEGDEVEVLMFVEDAGVLHPEWIESMTATLLYKGQHDLGSVSFDCTYATGDGDVQVMFIHPSHIEDLSVRLQGVINNCGDVDFTVAAGTVGSADSTFTPQVLPGVDNVPPRVEYGSGIVGERQLDPAPEEIDVVDSEVVLTLLDIDLLSDQEPLVQGSGPIDYQGGGDRLLPSLDNDGTFILQSAGVLAHSINGYTLIEPYGQNLLSNSTFETPTSSADQVPAGWSLSSSSTVTTIPTRVAVNDVYALKIRTFGSGPYVGPKRLTFESVSTVGVTSGSPITWSVLTRLETAERTANDIPTSVVKIDTLKLVVSFRDAGDAEISQQVASFDPSVIASGNFVLVQDAVPAPPAGTVGVRVSLQLESIEESDDVNFWLMAPQVELAPQASSRMVAAGSAVRLADTFRLPQAGNIETDRGNVKIDFSASYAGTPAADACLFDTRTNGFDGFALYHLADGRLRFVVAGPATDMTLETAPYSFGAGELHTVEASWSSSSRSIWVDGDEAIDSSAPVVLPQQTGEWIWLMRTAAGTNRFDGILTALEVSREPHAS